MHFIGHLHWFILTKEVDCRYSVYCRTSCLYNSFLFPLLFPLVKFMFLNKTSHTDSANVMNVSRSTLSTTTNFTSKALTVYIACSYITVPQGRLCMGPLTLKFARATLPFLKIDMRHETYRHGKKY